MPPAPAAIGHLTTAVEDRGKHHMTSEEALDEYGERVAAMAARVVEHSDATTARTSVPVGRTEDAVPYIAD